jgi:hypothetical protein
MGVDMDVDLEYFVELATVKDLPAALMLKR